MAFQTNSGARFGVSVAAPATFDAAGYAALTYTYASPEEIMNYDPASASWDTNQDDSYSNDDSASTKAKRRLGSPTLQLKYEKDNSALHTLLKDAELDKDAVLSIVFEHENGTDFRYYTAQISKYAPTNGSATDFMMHDLEFLQQTQTVEVNA